jgi:hypothetical protein
LTPDPNLYAGGTDGDETGISLGEALVDFAAEPGKVIFVLTLD